MTEKRFHGQSHMKGGIEINESELDPNAKYWRMFADGTYKALKEVVGENRAEELVAPYDFETFKDECLTLEKILAEQRKIKNEKSI